MTNEFQRLPDGSLILRGQKPAPPTRWQSIRAAVASFLDSLRPKSAQPTLVWLPDYQGSAATAEPVAQVPPSSPGALPAYNEWAAIEGKIAERERIKRELGSFPQQMMQSPLVEGKLW